MAEGTLREGETTRAAREAPAASGCCGPAGAATSQPATLAENTPPDDIRKLVREKYASIARGDSSCCGSKVDSLQDLGYSEGQAAAAPEGANLGLGCGNPLAPAGIRAGETVLDLGSGAGIDVFLAAREVGPGGRVLGVDMTPEMLERARENARRVGATNVEFRLGEIERLPVADASVDAVISNCVINLSPDKPRVFREAFRVLKPGGRLVVSDIVLLRPLPPAVRGSVEAYVGCVAGASLRGDYLRHIRDAGFDRVEVVDERAYPGASLDASEAIREGSGAVVSLQVRAWKP
jgi:SAM-dependent methyltransferase